MEKYDPSISGMLHIYIFGSIISMLLRFLKNTYYFPF